MMLNYVCLHCTKEYELLLLYVLNEGILFFVMMW